MYRDADVFVLPSVREPYGTVYGEAMAAGLPVVGWRAGNLPHLASHEREGLLVEPGDVRALTSALRRLTEDEELRTRLGAAASTGRRRCLPGSRPLSGSSPQSARPQAGQDGPGTVGQDAPQARSGKNEPNGYPESVQAVRPGHLIRARLGLFEDQGADLEVELLGIGQEPDVVQRLVLPG